WYGNALRFGTREEVEAQVQDLMMRWFAVKETRVVECDDPVNYRYVDGRLEQVGAAAASVAEAPSGSHHLCPKSNPVSESRCGVFSFRMNGVGAPRHALDESQFWACIEHQVLTQFGHSICGPAQFIFQH